MYRETAEFHSAAQKMMETGGGKSERFRYWACANPACNNLQLGGEVNRYGEGRAQCRACGWHTFYKKSRRGTRTIAVPPDIVRSMDKSEIQALLKGV